MGLIPLAEIPARFVGDPQAGLKEVLAHMPVASTMSTRSDNTTSKTWVLVARVNGKPVFEIPYTEPEERQASQRNWEVDKRRAISAWLTAVCQATLDYMARHHGASLPVIADPMVPVPPTIKQILQEAKITPALTPVRGSREDALVAKIIASRAPVARFTTSGYYPSQGYVDIVGSSPSYVSGCRSCDPILRCQGYPH